MTGVGQRGRISRRTGMFGPPGSRGLAVALARIGAFRLEAYRSAAGVTFAAVHESAPGTLGLPLHRSKNTADPGGTADMSPAPAGSSGPRLM